jgi:TonB family protein
MHNFIVLVLKKMLQNKKEKKFIKLPEYEGGPKAIRAFVKKHLIYPPKALAAGIEGHVLLSYMISDKGVVHGQHVIKSLGFDCDEEAIRVVGLLRFKPVKNRHFRVNAIKKMFIHFRLPKVNLEYKITYSSDKPDKETPEPKENSYGYTIVFNR